MSRTHDSAAVIVVSLSALCRLFLAGCSSNGDPFSYVKVSGKVTYEDGSLIPGEIWLRFIPQTAAVGKAYPRVAVAFVDRNTGQFRDVTTHAPHDGLVRGKHKVEVTGPSRVPSADEHRAGQIRRLQEDAAGSRYGPPAFQSSCEARGRGASKPAAKTAR